MTEARPIDVVRRDGALVPRQRWLFDRLFTEGQVYTIEIHEPRSDKSHNHFFAAVREAWKNLPEDLSAQHPDPEHLRKWALIKCGYSIKRNIVCESVAMAHQVAAVAGQLDESAVIVVQGSVVTIATARTQKTTGPGAMDRAEFQKSKQDVLDYCAHLIGVDVATLSSHVSHSSGGQQANDQADTPAADSDPDNHAAAGVSNSNSSCPADRTDDAPAGSGPQSAPAGATYSEASLLSDDWRDVYLQNLAGVRDKAASLLTRHGEAMQMIGQPNESELAWMRKAWRLVQRRNEGDLKRGEYDAKIAELKAVPLQASNAA